MIHLHGYTCGSGGLEPWRCTSALLRRDGHWAILLDGDVHVGEGAAVLFSLRRLQAAHRVGRAA